MSYTLRTILVAMLVVVLGAALFYGGIVYANARFSAWGPGMMGGVGPGGMMSGSGYSNPNNGDSGTGMMGGGGMMGNVRMMGSIGLEIANMDATPNLEIVIRVGDTLIVLDNTLTTKSTIKLADPNNQ